MDRSPGFGYTPRNSIALFRLAFATATPYGLTSLRKVTRWLIMQKARGHTVCNAHIVLPLLVGKRFQVLFTPLSGVLFTFPSRYWFTIGRQEVFSLMRWSSQIPTGFLVSRRTWVSDPESPIHFAYGTLTPYGHPFQNVRLYIGFVTSRRVRNPFRSDPATPLLQRFRAWHNRGLGSSPFARRYLGNHCCFLFLRLLRCFSSPRSPHEPMNSVRDAGVLPPAGSPIQTSPDQCLFSSSPKLIAAIHVFHRLLAPRHPPSALISLATN